MTNIASGSISQRHGYEDPDPDPPQNVMDPQHCSKQCFCFCRYESSSGRTEGEEAVDHTSSSSSSAPPLGTWCPAPLASPSSPALRSWTGSCVSHRYAPTWSNRWAQCKKNHVHVFFILFQPIENDEMIRFYGI
jgi:hypothetical protein